MPPLGARRLTPGLSASSPRFSPDGRSLLYLSHAQAVTTGVHNCTASLHTLQWPQAETHAVVLDVVKRLRLQELPAQTCQFAAQTCQFTADSPLDTPIRRTDMPIHRWTHRFTAGHTDSPLDTPFTAGHTDSPLDTLIHRRFTAGHIDSPLDTPIRRWTHHSPPIHRWTRQLLKGYKK
eukprot:3066458-Pyramimonas_sp.AAC.1